MIDITYTSLLELQSLQEIWISLEKGSDMTYFQTYNWYCMLAEIYSSKILKFEVYFVTIYNNRVPSLIAPIIIYRRTHKLINKKGIYFFGRKGWSDYLNIVYDKFDEKCVDFLFEELKSKYGISNFFFEQVKADTEFYNYLKRKNMISQEFKTECVKVVLPNTVNEYQKLLSKHSRQNIRTAKNRADKAGIIFSINFDDKTVDKVVCKEMREMRVKEKRAKEYRSMSFISKMKFKVKEHLEYIYPNYLPFFSDKNSKMLTVYDGDNLCGFFNYGIDKHHKTIVLMAVGTNENYARYSPGILALYSFICSKIEEGDIKCMDFTRGDEPYKFALGGGKNIINNTIIKWSQNKIKI